jgi:hypothetical protein
MSRTIYLDLNGNEIDPLTEPPIVTNADRIRGMTDEELAEWMHSISPADNWSWWLEGKTWLEWLKSSVEVDNG